jgi:DNA adenine methylase
VIARVRGKFLLTFDDTPEIRQYADEQGFLYESIPMQTTHHLEKHELLITDNLDWIR